MPGQDQLAEMVGPVYDIDTVAALLEIPAAAVPDACAEGRLLGMTTSDGMMVHPFSNSPTTP